MIGKIKAVYLGRSDGDYDFLCAFAPFEEQERVSEMLTQVTDNLRQEGEEVKVVDFNDYSEIVDVYEGEHSQTRDPRPPHAKGELSGPPPAGKVKPLGQGGRSPQDFGKRRNFWPPAESTSTVNVSGTPPVDRMTEKVFRQLR